MTVTTPRRIRAPCPAVAMVLSVSSMCLSMRSPPVGLPIGIPLDVLDLWVAPEDLVGPVQEELGSDRSTTLGLGVSLT